MANKRTSSMEMFVRRPKPRLCPAVLTKTDARMGMQGPSQSGNQAPHEDDSIQWMAIPADPAWSQRAKWGKIMRHDEKSHEDLDQERFSGRIRQNCIKKQKICSWIFAVWDQFFRVVFGSRGGIFMWFTSYHEFGELFGKYHGTLVPILCPPVLLFY